MNEREAREGERKREGEIERERFNIKPVSFLHAELYLASNYT